VSREKILRLLSKVRWVNADTMIGGAESPAGVVVEKEEVGIHADVQKG
jgi:hypothetical protein